MKLQFVFALLCALLVACGGSSTKAASKSGSAERITDPAKLPEDQEGLKEVYKSLFGELVETMEGVDTEEQLEKALDNVKSLGPAFQAVMTRSENLDFSVEEGSDGEIAKLQDRLDAAMKSLMQKHSAKAMEIMNAFSGAMAEVAPR